MQRAILDEINLICVSRETQKENLLPDKEYIIINKESSETGEHRTGNKRSGILPGAFRGNITA